MWRLLRVLCAAVPVAAVAAATLFLFLDGSKHASFGNFSFARLWQGKVVLVAVFVPLLWTYAVRWGRDGSKRDLAMLAAANVAAAGLSSTGLFVAPLATALVSASIALRVRSVPRLAAAAAAAAYPAALAVLNRAADARLEATPSNAAGVAPWSRWAFVFGRPALALTAVALTLAWATARDRTARTLLTVAPLVLVVALHGPRLLDPLRTLTPGAASILWRTVWVVPVPVFVGMVVALPLARRARDGVGAATTGLMAAAVAIFAMTTTPVMSADNRAIIGRPHWKTGGETQVAQRLVGEVPSGSVVAGPFAVDRVVPLISSDVRAVDPRPGWYAKGIDPRPRRLVQRVLTAGLEDVDPAAFTAAMDSLGVDAVALPERLGSDAVTRLLTDVGFVLLGVERQYLLFERAG
jgi:hypothetical protein